MKCMKIVLVLSFGSESWDTTFRRTTVKLFSSVRSYVNPVVRIMIDFVYLFMSNF